MPKKGSFIFSVNKFGGAFVPFPVIPVEEAPEKIVSMDNDGDYVLKKREELVKKLIYEIGDDPDREGVIGTPERVVRMWGEIFAGYNEANKPKVSIFNNGKDGISYDQMITDTGTFHSHCEHHMVPFFGRYWFAYIPSEKGGIIGLSKVARLVDFHSARLQIQERLVHDIVEDIWKTLSPTPAMQLKALQSEKALPKNEVWEEPLGMVLVMEGEHLCKTMRGVKKQGVMRTTKVKGVFSKRMNNSMSEFMQFVGK